MPPLNTPQDYRKPELLLNLQELNADHQRTSGLAMQAKYLFFLPAIIRAQSQFQKPMSFRKWREEE